MKSRFEIPSAGIFCTLMLVVSMPAVVRAEAVEYDLTIAREQVTISGTSAEGMTINGGIPGPTLRFKEGDTARIHVHNRMPVATSIHWHGLLVPPDMDGVPYISFPPIAPHTTFTYEFPIRQSGTYWYHSHSSLQEQRGVYGAIVIEPVHAHGNQRADREQVVLFSDWTIENPHRVLRSLKRGSEWYAVEKGSGQSILGAARVGLLGDYLRRELQRMPAMDIADVAYDYFLANGLPEAGFEADGGETLRLRVINGSATTYFHLEFAGGPMTIVAADGLDVAPLKRQRFLIAVAETYDVLVKVPDNGSYELRATAHDGSGYASVWVGNGRRLAAPDVPTPNLYQGMHHGGLSSVLALTPAGAMGMPDRDVNAGKLDQPGMAGMETTSMGKGHGTAHGADASENGKAMQHDSHAGHGKLQAHAETAPPDKGRSAAHPAPTGPRGGRGGKKYATDFRPFASDVSSRPEIAADGSDPSRPWAPYAELRSVRSTAFDRSRPVREIRLTLDGDMERYVWLMNNTALSESDVIRICEGEITRFVMINRTMMHHPMHLHGHFFRVLNGQGDYAPLKHTVDVAPMSTTVIEFYGNEFGDWFFHCHLLYHMKSGMARVIHYDGYQPDPAVAAIRQNIFKESWYLWAEADVLSNMTEGAVTLSDTRNILKAGWEVGWQGVDETHWEGLLSYDRWVNRFFSVLGGVDVIGEGDSTEDTRGVLGFRYLLPLNFESRLWVDSDGGARIILEKELVLTPRLTLIGEVKYDTHDRWEGKTGLAYLLNNNVSLTGQWHSEYGWGGGLQIRF